MTRQIPWAQPHFWGDEQQFVQEALASTWISAGPFVDRLERDFAALHGMEHGLSCANGTASLFLALHVLGVGPGDEVVVPAFGFIAPVNMVLALGATPVFADVDPQTWLMDPASVAQLIGPRTKVLLPVHSYGNVCDMPALAALAEAHDLDIIEDCAEAVFSRFDARLAGSFSTISSFSFQTTKTITCGEGGMLLCRDPELAQRMRRLKSHGAEPGTYRHDGVAYNFRLTNYQAAMAVAQLGHREAIEAARAQLFGWYRQRFAGLDCVQLQSFAAPVQPVVWALGLRLGEGWACSRDELRDRLQGRGIECRPGFATCASMPAYQAPARPVAEVCAQQIICLPFHLGMVEDDVEYIYQQFLEQCP